VAFFDRSKEKAFLDQLVNSEKQEVFILYGRRRVGKTALLNEITRNKRGVYFTGRQVTAEELLRSFSASVSQLLNTEGLVFATWEAALEKVFELGKTQSVFLVIDEFQYMVEVVPSLPSILQHFIDQNIDGKLNLLLCGSSISFMEGILSYRNPLFGRKTGYINLKAISFEESKEFLPKLDYHSLLEAYSITGGIPLYLLLWNERKNTRNNITELFLSIGSPLKEEPVFILMQELREPRVYHSILQAIAAGRKTPADISSRIGTGDSRMLQPYLNTLRSLGIVQRVTNALERNPARTRKVIYEISDPLFRFWFTFIFPYLDAIERQQLEVLQRKLSVDFEQYVSFEFEFLARKKVSQLFSLDSVGRYWKKDIEIDILGIKDSEIIVGEVKWRNKKMTLSDLRKLQEKCGSARIEPSRYILVSKSGFDESLLASSSRNSLFLLSFDKQRGWIEEKQFEATAETTTRENSDAPKSRS